MRKFGKLINGIVASALSLSMCVAVAACNEGGGNGEEKYTVAVDGALRSWQFNFVNISEFGDEHWGMINLEDWGNKKLALNTDNTCIGTGCAWRVELVVNGDEYELYTIAHLTGNGTVYDGEGDYAYMFEGACSKVSGGYKLEAPTYVEVSLTEGFNLIYEGPYDFANYIPSGPWKIDSTMSDDDEFVKSRNDSTAGTVGLNDKLWPSILVSTVFGGATFKVSGDKITSVVDVTLPM